MQILKIFKHIADKKKIDSEKKQFIESKIDKNSWIKKLIDDQLNE